MKQVWTVVTIVLAVAGAIGLYNETSKLFDGSATINTVLRVGLSLLCLVLAPKAYSKSKSAP